MNDGIELSGMYLHQTPQGIKIDFSVDGEATWLPKSQIQILEHTARELVEGTVISVEIPEWLAIEKGLV